MTGRFEFVTMLERYTAISNTVAFTLAIFFVLDKRSLKILTYPFSVSKNRSYLLWVVHLQRLGTVNLDLCPGGMSCTHMGYQRA